MTGEEAAGPAGPKVLRLLYFVGAGHGVLHIIQQFNDLGRFGAVLCTAAVNKWRYFQEKSIQDQQNLREDLLSEKPSNSVCWSQQVTTKYRELQ
ncbi:hypothetical protein NMG60_11036956 [Bertholletia excelsa]